MTRMIAGGTIRSRQQIIYTETAIIASRPPTVEVRAVTSCSGGFPSA